MDIFVMLHGQNPQKERVLELLGLKLEDITRFRDCGYDQEKEIIWVLTRTGSTNAFKKSNNHLGKNINYLSSTDVIYDPTYEFTFFKMPVLANITGITHYPVPNFKKVIMNGLKDIKNGKINAETANFMKNLVKRIEKSDGIISLLDPN